jgi:hypothetical protein
MLNTRGIKIQVKDPVAPRTQDKKTQTPQSDLGRIVEEGGRVVSCTADVVIVIVGGG